MIVLDLLASFALAYATVIVAVVLLWAWSLRIRNASIIDLFWGPGFVLVAAAVWLLERPEGLYPAAIALMPTLWAARYASHIFPRNWGHGEDPRYTKLRSWARDEAAFARLSLTKVFLLQGHVMVVVASPVIVALSLETPPPAPLLLPIGAAVWFAGLAIEWVADEQLKRFKADPANAGRILDAGLWAWSRHPNYFGDALMWWGVWLAACAHPIAAPSIVGPILMTHFLVNVTGAATLDKKMAREKPGYAEYMARTSGFIPRPPKR